MGVIAVTPHSLSPCPQLFLNLRSGNMKILWLFVVIHAAASQPGFGTPYLRNSKLCHQWSCLNTKLGLPPSLPPAAQLGSVLRTLLPPSWHTAVEGTLNTCYHDRPRRYTNTCPGQAILHCVFDQLIANCPESYQRKEDACAPINSLAGFQYMFTQSRYENIERNIEVERRPAWFLRNYFNTKCCNVPAIFNSTVLAQCGFSNMIQYYIHNPTVPTPGVLPSQRRFMTAPLLSPQLLPPPPPPSHNGDSLQVVSLKDFLAGNVPNAIDPLDCCDIHKFIEPSWRHECNFEVNWGGQRRLVIKDEVTAAPEPTTTTRPVVRRDITVVPHSCEYETCVFTQLNIIRNGSVDIDSFSRLLDNLTASQPSWTSAKGRALTTCLRKPLADYNDDCEINKILSCTFDVLTENCPNTPKNDLCKHSTSERTCQISSSKYRPKHRREICLLPDLVDREILRKCGLTSLSQVKPTTTTIAKPKTYKLFDSRNKCKDLTPSTTCVLSKMGVLNKYGFMDDFQIKDRVRYYTGHEETTLERIYIGVVNDAVMYGDHCNSPKKLLNVLDSMLMTCPKIRSQNTTQCASLFNQVNNTPVKNVSTEHTQRVLNHFLHVYNPLARTPKTYRPRHIRKIKKSPIYHYGILNDNNAPKIMTIDVKPKKPLVEKPPLVLLPVYMRVPQSNLMIRRPFLENGVMRGFPMNNPTNNSHIPNITKHHHHHHHHHHNTTTTSTTTTTTTPSPVSTTSISTTPISTSWISTTPISKRTPTVRPFSTIFKFPRDERFDMIKPE